jgi:hypothetical protein
MRVALLCVFMLIIGVSGTGCVSRSPNPDITVTSPDIDDMTPVNAGSFDIYTAEFQIKNPTNQTFSNVEVKINLIPALSYCHSLSKSMDYPVLNPQEKKTEPISIAEFSDLGCRYSFLYDVASER